jgi:hypothetical protein
MSKEEVLDIIILISKGQYNYSAPLPVTDKRYLDETLSLTTPNLANIINILTKDRFLWVHNIHYYYDASKLFRRTFSTFVECIKYDLRSFEL